MKISKIFHFKQYKKIKRFFLKNELYPDYQVFPKFQNSQTSLKDYYITKDASSHLL